MPTLAAPSDIDDLSQKIKDCQRITLDTEFHAEQTYVPKLYLIQLQVRQEIWLVDPLIPGLVEGLREALLSVEWIVHGGSQDMLILQHHLGGLPRRIWDSQIAAALLSAHNFPAGFGTLVARYLNRSLSKGATLSDWSRRPLSEAQQQYAADDVAFLTPLYAVLESRLRDIGRLDLAAAACDEARAAIVSPPPLSRAWLRLSGRERLTRREAAICQELAVWRERTAQRRDQPVRSVLSDALLVTLARRPPGSRAELDRNRRFPKRLAKLHGDALIETITRGANKPEAETPDHVRRNTPAMRRLRWLDVVAECLAYQHDVAPGLLMPPGLREELARTVQTTPDLTWRTPLLSETLEDLSTGATAVVMENGVPVLGPVATHR